MKKTWEPLLQRVFVSSFTFKKVFSFSPTFFIQKKTIIRYSFYNIGFISIQHFTFKRHLVIHQVYTNLVPHNIKVILINNLKVLKQHVSIIPACVCECVCVSICSGHAYAHIQSVCMYLCECKIGFFVLVQALSLVCVALISVVLVLDAVLPETLRIPSSLPELLPDAEHMAEWI